MDRYDALLTGPLVGVAILAAVIWYLWRRRGRQVDELTARLNELTAYVVGLDEADRLASSGHGAPVRLPTSRRRLRVIQGGRRLALALGMAVPARALYRTVRAHPLGYAMAASAASAALVTATLWVSTLAPERAPEARRPAPVPSPSSPHVQHVKPPAPTSTPSSSTRSMTAVEEAATDEPRRPRARRQEAEPATPAEPVDDGGLVEEAPAVTTPEIGPVPTPETTTPAVRTRTRACVRPLVCLTVDLAA